MSMRSDRSFDGEGSDLQEKVVHIRRVAKVVKGGRHLRFNAMVVVGDGRGRVGYGLGKGAAVPDAVRKGTAIAKKGMTKISLQGGTIPHAITVKFGASKVLLKPASAGAGIIAGGAVRAVMEAVGVKDVVAKALGSRNPINLVKAAMVGLESFHRVGIGRAAGNGDAPEPASSPQRAPRARTRRPAAGAATAAPTAPVAAAPEVPTPAPVEEPQAPEASTPAAAASAEPEAPEAASEAVPEAVIEEEPASAETEPSEPESTDARDEPNAMDEKESANGEAKD